MQLFIAADTTRVMRFDDASAPTCAALTSEIERATGIPADAQILRAGGRLLRSAADFDVLTSETTVRVTHRLCGGASKKRCQHTECSAPALRGLDCSRCSGVFCAKHRLLEQHNCKGLADCKAELRAANQARLESERCVASRVA
ncbi:hypothetical protein PYCC9005_005120 [Savitreella phatthalungensis]